MYKCKHPYYNWNLSAVTGKCIGLVVSIINWGYDLPMQNNLTVGFSLPEHTHKQRCPLMMPERIVADMMGPDLLIRVCSRWMLMTERTPAGKIVVY